MAPASKFKVKTDDLRWWCDPAKFDFKTTDELKPMGETVGQERAIKALKLGLALFNPGYNIFVAGLTGSGKTSTVKNILDRIKPNLPPPADRIYVNSFKDPHLPRLLTLPRGDGRRLKEGMEELIRFLLKNIPLVFEDETFQKRREEIMEKYGGEEKRLFAEFSEKIKTENFTLAQIQMGPFTRPDLFPVHEGKAFPIDKIDEMVREGKIEKADGRRIRQRHGKFRGELESLMERSRDLARQMVADLDDLARSMGHLAVSGYIQDLKSRFDSAEVGEYVDEVEESILENLDLFRGKGTDGPADRTRGKAERSGEFRDFRVNVIMDNSEREAVPVIIETNPTYSNLFGTIEKTLEARSGMWTSDFTKIKAGSILQADGGYLVVNAYDLFNEPGVWKVLKRTLKNRKLIIQPPDVAFFFGQSTLKPSPIDLTFKLILIGDWWIYHYLYHYEPEFKKIFKVLADFAPEMELDDTHVQSYARFVKKICDEENVLPFDPSGVARLVEYGVWRAGRSGKLTALFSDIADIVRESAYWAEEAGEKVAKHAHVSQAIRAGIERHSLPETRLREQIERGSIFIDVVGEAVGQVNGLSVYDLGNYNFGAPARITASVSTGR
ncbi:MAG: AAA family ATPase, partial [Planctomycetota bacterium]